MEVFEVFEYGLKNNWREFKKFVENHKKSPITEYFFVIKEDDGVDKARVFTNHSQLDEWLEKCFWEWERYSFINLEESMNDVYVWRLIPESEVERKKHLCEGSKPTSIVKNGERYFRKRIPINVEETIRISVSTYLY